MFLCNLQNLSFPTTNNFFQMNILFELSQAYKAYPIQKRDIWARFQTSRKRFDIQQEAIPLTVMRSLNSNKKPTNVNACGLQLWHRCFPVNFVKFLRTPFLQNTSRRQLIIKTILKTLQHWKSMKVGNTAQCKQLR